MDVLKQVRIYSAQSPNTDYGNGYIGAGNQIDYSSTATSIIVNAGDKCWLRAVPVTDYTKFVKWNKNGSQFSTSSQLYFTNYDTQATVEGELVYTAVFQGLERTVRFDGNGGTVQGALSKTVTNGSTYGQLPTATRTNCTFNGWYVSPTGGTKIDSSWGVWLGVAEQTLYAGWSVNTVTLTYNANSGSGTTSYNVAQGSSIALSNGSGFSKTGYTIDGWSTSPTGAKVYNLGQTITVSSAITLYAHWTPITYNIKFYKNHPDYAQETRDQSGIIYDQTIQLVQNQFTAKGYTFIGWTQSQTGSGTLYLDGASVKNLSSTNGTTVNLYAKWKVTVYRFNEAGQEWEDITTSNANIPKGIHKADDSGNWGGL